MPRIIVYHTGYGCETGCCGHAIEVDGEHLHGSFEFDHPYDLYRFSNDVEGRDQHIQEYVKDKVRQQMGEEHIKDIDFSMCIVSDD